jgi:hypothetical protein
MKTARRLPSNLWRNSLFLPELEVVLARIRKLRRLHKEGLLGGENMPEDANPGLDRSAKETVLYFTLPMALNYQRNSYKLWEAALATYLDKDTSMVFDPKWASTAPIDELRSRLCKYKLALQPNKHINTWRRLSESIVELFEGDLRNLFTSSGFCVGQILTFIQVEHKKAFPYLSGNKICHYWLYVLEQYCDIQWLERDKISVAPDTHVIQASIALGIISSDSTKNSQGQKIVSEAWRTICHGSELVPIDVHTPLWLWSRRGCPPLE